MVVLKEGITIVKLNEPDLMHVWDNMREYDRKELDLQDQTRNRIKLHLNDEYAFIGKYKGKPFVAWGVFETIGCMHYWFFGTDDADKRWRTIHMVAKVFIPWIAGIKFGKHVLVEVSDKHTTSLRWLKRLGFKPTIHKFTKHGETMILMEWKNV